MERSSIDVFLKPIAEKLLLELSTVCERCKILNLVYRSPDRFEIEYLMKPQLFADPENAIIYGKCIADSMLDKKLVDLCFLGFWDIQRVTPEKRVFLLKHEGKFITVTVNIEQ